jgi:hypothetical protein
MKISTNLEKKKALYWCMILTVRKRESIFPEFQGPSICNAQDHFSPPQKQLESDNNPYA